MPLFYCLGFSKAFLRQNKGKALIVVISSAAMIALGMWVHVAGGAREPAST